MGENEIWCHAWRLIVKHEGNVDAIIISEIDKCIEIGDIDEADYWRRVLDALDDLR